MGDRLPITGGRPLEMALNRDLSPHGVLLCPGCDRVYEAYRTHDNRRHQQKVEYFHDYPRIGLEKRVCPQCKEKKDG